MAIARPVRVLGALSIVLVIFLLYTVLKSPTRITPIGDQTTVKVGDTIDDMQRDPLLDGTLSENLDQAAADEV